MTALDVAAAVRSGERSAVSVVEEHLAAVDAREADVHAFNAVLRDEALAAAAAVDAQVAAGNDPGPLAGVPVALKDNLCTRGIPTTCSSKILEGWRPPYDATVVSRLAAAGAIAIGKANLDEFAMGSSTEHSAFGPTRNPHDLSRVPGGSSGGSAAAVAAGFAPLALGSDTGGSVRLPAAYCGVVGMKPTYGAVSRYGLIAFASSLDQIGPFAATVADAALLLEVIGGHDPLDSTSIASPAPAISGVLDDGVEGLRIGLVTELSGEGTAPDVARRVAEAVAALESAGAKVEEVSVPATTLGLSAYYLIAPAEASSNLARYDGVRYGLRVDAPTNGEMNVASRTAGFGAEVKRRIMLGTYALSAGYYDAYYGKAQQVRTLIIRDFAAAYERFDLLLSPTAPTTAFAFGDKTADPLAMYLTDVCTIPSNLAGDPAISVPFGTGDDGLPVGVQLLAPALGEPTLFRAAAVLEAAARASLVDRCRRSVVTVTDPGSGTVVEPFTVTADDGSTWELVVGLEVHCELATATKIFCGCRNEFGSEPNTNVCPVCLGLPGSLPVLNRQVVELAMRLGRALQCSVEPSVFHRKNYFYPDMPKDYQVSQYDRPINVDGSIELPDGSVVGIERAHLEEDTGKSTHVGGGGRIHDAVHSLVDYNRAGVPLVEIVGRPHIRTPEQARAYVQELRAVLLATGASDAKMEEGSMRVDANVSVRPVGTDELGTRCEIKNLNSTRSLVRAIEYEARRQVDLLTSGERIRQQTRHWDEADGRTHTLRSKEEADDYRYFPEPDLVPLEPDAAWLAAVDAALPVLPAARRRTLAERTGAEAPVAALVVERDLDALVLAALDAGGDAGRLVTRAANDLADGPGALTPEAFAALSRMEADGALTATQAKAVLAELVASGGDPVAVAAARGFEAMGDDALATAVDAAIAAEPDAWQRYVAGDQKVTGLFVGLVMKATQGKADGKAVTALLRERAAAG